LGELQETLQFHSLFLKIRRLLLDVTGKDVRNTYKKQQNLPILKMLNNSLLLRRNWEEKKRQLAA